MALELISEPTLVSRFLFFFFLCLFEDAPLASLRPLAAAHADNVWHRLLLESAWPERTKEKLSHFWPRTYVTYCAMGCFRSHLAQARDADDQISEFAN